MTLIERSTVRVHFQRLRAALQRSEFGLKCFAAYTVVLRLSAPLPGGGYLCECSCSCIHFCYLEHKEERPSEPFNSSKKQKIDEN